MTDSASTARQTATNATAANSDHLTRLDLTWIEGEIEQWLRFGTAVAQHRADRHRRVLSFAPGASFGLVRWASNGFGTVLSRLDVVRTVELGAALQTLPLVRPGGEVLLTVSGWPRVQRVLGHIDAIEAAGIDPAEVDPDHWRHVHHRIAAGHEPSAYTFGRHRASLLRRSVRA